MSRHTRGETAPEQQDGLYTSLSKMDAWEYRFRIVTEAISWRQYFPESGGVTRVDKQPEGEPSDGKVTDYWQSTRKFFYAFGVVNVDTLDVSIMHLDKMGVVRDLENYSNDPDYGDPRWYDIVIVKQWSWKDTKYSMKVKPPKEVTKEILEASSMYEFDLDQYYVAKGTPIKKLSILDQDDDESPL